MNQPSLFDSSRRDSLFSSEELAAAKEQGPLRNKPIAECCTPDFPGTGPEGQTCGSCIHRQRYKGSSKQWYKCRLAYSDLVGLRNRIGSRAGGKMSDIKMRWPACSHWRPDIELFQIVPEGYPEPDTMDDWRVMADYMEEHGFPHAKIARDLLSTSFLPVELAPF